MMMRTILLGAALVLFHGFAHAASRPNVIVFLADDQGWGDLSINGNTNLRTPQIDSLARDGARFERFFVQPVCAPTRAEFLTGRYHPRGGVTGVSTGAERLNLDERTLAEAFRDSGYATACFGKWHNGSQYPYHPRGRGFDEYYGFTSGHWADYFDAPLDHNGRDARGTGYITDDLTTRALAFIAESAQARKPFFCYLAYNTPHSPMQVPEPYWKRFAGAPLSLTGTGKEDMNHTRAALAMCENIDTNVGRVLESLRMRKLESETIVVYFSDNGPNGPRWNGRMKGRKGSTDEGGVRSALHIRWPGHIAPATVVRPIAGAIDLFPTLLALTGGKDAARKPLDGLDLSGWLLGRGGEFPERVLFQTWAGRASARSQKFRLDHEGNLFDMEKDPEQTRDARREHATEHARFTRLLADWRQTMQTELKRAVQRPFPVGHGPFPRAILPARDGVAQGGVVRSAAAPNCSYFTRWTSPEGRMTWDIEVATPGRYEAIVRYTCPPAETGSEVRLTWQGMTWKGTVAEGFDPPLRGQESDRVPRMGESYMKDFRPLSLGSLDLPAGRGLLTLAAARVVGKQVADVRAVELILQPPGR